MGRNKYRVIIDTNIWISFLFGKSLTGLVDYLNSGRIRIILSQFQIDELILVLTRPKFHKYFSSSNIIEFLELLELVSDVIEIDSDVKVCRDPKDNYLLAMAVNGKADFLVTGDLDLLDLDCYQDTRIINYQVFEDLMQG